MKWKRSTEWDGSDRLLYVEAYELYDCDCPDCESGVHASEHGWFYAAVEENDPDVNYLIETLIEQVWSGWPDFEYTYLWTTPSSPPKCVWGQQDEQ
jgi:hypothetical protein